MRIVRILDAIDNILVKITTWAATTAMGLVCVVMLSQVFLRRVFNRPIIWAEDLAVFLFIWITFIGGAILYQQKSLSSVDTLVAIFPAKLKVLAGLFVDLVVLLASIYLLKLSFDFIVRQQSLGHKLGGALGVPNWIVTISIVLSMGLIILFSLTSIVKTVCKSIEKQKEKVE